MKRTGFVAAIAAAVAVLAAAPAIAADVKCAWSSPTSDTQIARKGRDVMLKGGVVSTVDPAVDPIPAYYVWSFGDNTADVRTDIAMTYGWRYNPATGSWEEGLTTNFRPLTTVHQYKSNGNYAASLKVYDSSGNLLGQDVTTVAVGNSATDLEISVDNALWYLHTQIVPVGADLAGWRDRNYDEGLVMIANTFQKEGFLASSANTADPYVDDVRRLVNGVLANLYSVTEGVYYCQNDETTYGFGPALEALSRSGYPASFATSQGPLGDAIQSMVNWIAWFQLGTSGFDWQGCTIVANPAKAPCPAKVDGGPSTAGGWPYLTEGWGCDGSTINKSTKGVYGDRSVSYWMVSGLDAAESFGATVPATVRQNLAAFLNSNNPCAADNFGPTHGWNLIERVGQGLTLYKWLSKDPAYANLGLNSDPKVQECATNITSWFPLHNFQHGQDHPEASEQCSASSLDGAADCYSHFKNNAWDLGYFDEFGQWVSTARTHDINIFSFKTVAEGVKKYPGLTALPCSTYPAKLADNQKAFGDGSLDDSGWVTGYLFGVAWAADSLGACR